MTTTAYFDIRCVDDVDPFGRDATPLEALEQDAYHLLITDKFCLFRDLDWGENLENELGRPLRTTLAADIESALRRDARVADVKCTVTPVADEPDAHRINLAVQADDGFLELAVILSPSGVRRADV